MTPDREIQDEELMGVAQDSEQALRLRRSLRTIAGATLRIGLVNMLTTWMCSLLVRSEVMNSSNCIVDVVRVNAVRSGGIRSSSGHVPFQPAGTSSPQ